MKNVTLRQTVMDTSQLIRTNIIRYIVVTTAIAILSWNVSGAIVPILAEVNDGFQENAFFVRVLLTFIAHLVILKTAIVHYTYQTIRVPGISVRSWWKGVEIEEAVRLIFRIFGVYVAIFLIYGPMFLLLLLIGVWGAEEIESRRNAFIAIPSTEALFLVVLISILVLSPLVARFWLAIPNAVLSSGRVLLCFRNSAVQTKGHVFCIISLILLSTVPCLLCSFLFTEWTPHASISSIFILIVIAISSLFDAVAVTVVYSKLE